MRRSNSKATDAALRLVGRRIRDTMGDEEPASVLRGPHANSAEIIKDLRGASPHGIVIGQVCVEHPANDRDLRLDCRFWFDAEDVPLRRSKETPSLLNLRTRNPLTKAARHGLRGSSAVLCVLEPSPHVFSRRPQLSPAAGGSGAPRVTLRELQPSSASQRLSVSTTYFPWPPFAASCTVGMTREEVVDAGQCRIVGWSMTEAWSVIARVRAIRELAFKDQRSWVFMRLRDDHARKTAELGGALRSALFRA